MILSGEIFFLVFIILKFPGTPPPPLKILRTLVVRTIGVDIALKILIKDENWQKNF